MMKLSVSEILNKASNSKTEQERITILQSNYSVPLETVIRGALDPNIKWLLPEGEPPYKPNPLVDQQNVFFRECRKLYLFIDGGSPNLKQLRREAIFIELLEVVDPQDAKLLVAIKDKKMPYKNITKELVNKAFPGLIPT